MIVYFDGVCGLCHWAVRWIVKRDTKGLFSFAPLQGETAKEQLRSLRASYPKLDSLVLQVGDERLIEAKAALRIAWLIGGVWAIPGVLSFLPSCLLNWAYRLVARNRYEIFGQVSEEELASISKRAKFLP